MIKLFTGMLSFVLLAQGASAEPSAVLRDNVLTIPGGAVIDEGGVAYYRDIRLVVDDEGDFQVAAAKRSDLAEVDSVEAEVAGDNQVDVTVEGTKSACVDLLEPAISREGEEFTVVLPVSEPGSEVCILRLDFFETDFSLDAGDLESGTYTVSVNGVEADFTL